MTIRALFRRSPPIPAVVQIAACYLGLFFLVSCASSRMAELESSVGRATQAEMTARFGYPQRLKKAKDGEAWEYEFVAKDGQCVGYRVFFDNDLRSQRWEPLACR